MKTIVQILTENLKNKWVAGHLFGSPSPSFSGIVENVEFRSDRLGDTYLRLTLNTGQSSGNVDIYDFLDLKLTVC